MPQEHPPPPMLFVRGVARLCRFDLQRFRVLIAVLAGLELLRAAFIEWFLQRAPLATDGRFGSELGRLEFDMLAPAFSMATAVATAVLVQADHPADDRAFWRSRPISAWQLGIAKLTLLSGVFVAVPALLNALRLASYGAPPSAFVAATVQVAVTSGWIVVPCSALALAARTLPRFLVSAAAALVGLVILVRAMVPSLPVVVRLAIADRYPRPTTLAFDWQRLELHGWVAALVATAVGLVIVAAHYRHRSLRVTGALLALLVAAAALPGGDRAQPARPELTALVADRIRFEGSLTLSAPPGASSRPLVQWAAGRLAPLPLPSTVTASLELRQVRLHLAGAAVAPAGSTICCADGFAAATLTAATGVPSRPSLDQPNTAVVFTLTSDDAERLRNQTVDVDAEVRVRFTHHRLVGELPLRAGVAFRTRDYLIEVLRVDLVTRTALCRLVRFPTLTIPPTRLSLFVGNRSTRVEPSILWWQLEPGAIRRDDGRSWGRRVSVPLLDLAAAQTGSRLLIVESTRAGDAATRLTGRNVAIVTTRPNPLE